MRLLWLLLPVVVIAVLLWSYRRKVAKREVASAERMKAFLAGAKVDAKAAPGTPATPAPPAPPATPVTPIIARTAASAGPAGSTVRSLPATRHTAPAPSAAGPASVTSLKPAVVAGFSARVQYVRPEHMPLYRLLQSVLPQHGIFPQVMLPAFIQPSENLTGFAREAQEARLHGLTVDFLVCDPALRPVAVVQCEAVHSAPEASAFAAACVAACGVRWVAISPGTLPAPGEIRVRVLGA